MHRVRLQEIESALLLFETTSYEHPCRFTTGVRVPRPLGASRVARRCVERVCCAFLFLCIFIRDTSFFKFIFLVCVFADELEFIDIHGFTGAFIFADF